MIHAILFCALITKQSVIDTTNADRLANGSRPLTENVMLDRAAQHKAQDMRILGYFAHQNPQGYSPWDFIEREGYHYVMAGENLAIDFVDVGVQENAWMDSPGHRDNLLNANFQDIGVGIAGNITVVEFGNPYYANDKTH